MAEKKRTVAELDKRVTELTNLTNVLNNAIVAIAYATGVKGDALDKVSADEYVEYVQKNIHPITRRATDIVVEVSKKAYEEIEAAKKEEEKK